MMGKSPTYDHNFLASPGASRGTSTTPTASAGGTATPRGTTATTYLPVRLVQDFFSSLPQLQTSAAKSMDTITSMTSR